VTQVVAEILRYPVVPAVKELCAHLTGDSAWRAVLPPLEPLNRQQAARLCAAFDAAVMSVPA
jgi:4-hydroxy-tetrahydrodipicolinate synthase